MKTPHLLLTASNINRMRENLKHILDAKAMQAIDDELETNVAQLFRLGEEYLLFAGRQKNWRQCVSRLYYAAYNVTRAVRLACEGTYSRDPKEHKKISDLPKGFSSKSGTYSIQLPLLRDDRNLCDYDHTAAELDLIIPRKVSIVLVQDFINDAKLFLHSKGYKL